MNPDEMTSEETITFALRKAERNGFTVPKNWIILRNGNILKGQATRGTPYQMIIFSHEFAKAFWGEEILFIDPYGKYGYDGDCQTCLIKLPAWQYYLQQMVIEKNPLKYLKQFLTEG